MSETTGRRSVPPGAGEGGSLEDLFADARADGFTPAEMNELSSRLGVAAAGPGPHSVPGTGPASSVVVAGGGLKMLAGVLLAAGLVVAGATAHFWPSPARAPTAPSVVAAPVQASEARVAPRVVGPVEPGPPVVAVTDLPSVSGSVRAVAQVRVPASLPAVTPAPGPAATLDRGASGASAPAGASANGSAITATPSSPPGASPRANDTTAAPVLDPPPSEAATLLRARRELSTDPAGALALTEEAARAFPAGALAPERNVLAIEALARLGRMSEASARLDAFRQRYPGSLHIARLQALIRP